MGKSLLNISDDNEKETDELIHLCKQESEIHDIAIIGMCIKSPSADNLEQFWTDLKNGISVRKEIPANRREKIEKYLEYNGIDHRNVNYPKGGYLDDIQSFDYSFFNISPKEASLIDPNQRIFLETAWGAMEDAGYGGDKLYGSHTGVYVGYGKDSEYREMIKKVEPESAAMSISGNIRPMVASRISYIMDLKGPSMIVNTACSSALVAIHLACQALRNRECDTAIAGGVKIKILPYDNEVKVGIEAKNGITRAFADDSDGTGGGEGVAAILLKPLTTAREDKDHIYAIIRGSAVNQDGRSVGITAPNPLSQEEVIVNAWKDARIDPTTIGYIEAHGTGTRLGDPIEIDGITRAFRRYTDRKQFCAVGSIKSNYGHLDNAAGIFGLIKAVMALYHKEIPASLHFDRPNRNIAFENSPVYVNNRLTEWKTDNIRRCGVSAFGLSGTNCHIVLEEAKNMTPLEETEIGESQEIVTISACNENVLHQLVRSYSKYLNENQVSLRDFCYTANTGRGQYAYRIAIIVSSVSELIRKLDRVTTFEKFHSVESENIYYGYHKIVDESRKEQNEYELTEQERKLLSKNAEVILPHLGLEKTVVVASEVAKLYVKGAMVAWDCLYENKQCRISIPTYPFERVDCWLQIPDRKISTSKIGWNALLKEKEIPKELYEQIKELVDHWYENNQRNDQDIVLENIEPTGRADKKYSDMECKLVQVWGTILGFHEINIFDSFYQLGGDSLIAIRIVNHAKDRYHFILKIEDVMKYETIEKIAAYLESKQLTLTKRERISFVKHTGLDYFPLSSAQKRMFILNQMNKDVTNYNITTTLMIYGELVEDMIAQYEHAFQVLIDRHEGLRTSFTLIDGKPVQKIHEKVEFHLNYMDCDEENISEEIQRLIQPFDISMAPLFRVNVLRIREDKSLLLFDIHHIIADGSSLKIIVDEFFQILRGEALRPFEIQYKDYAIWQNELESNPKIEEEKKYWMNQLSGKLPILNLPLDYERPCIQSFEGDTVSFVIEPQIYDRLKAYTKETGTTLYMFLMSVWYVLLYRYTDQEDIIIGMPVEGRTEVELETIVGMFVNTLALRNYPAGDKSFSDFLNELKKSMMEAYSNQDYQYENLIDDLKIERDMSRNPLMDVVFNYISSPTGKNIWKNLSMEPYDIQNKKTLFDLMITAKEMSQEIRIDINFGTALYKRETIQRMIDTYQTIMIDILKNPSKKLCDIEIMNSYEKNKLLYEFNPKGTESTVSRSIHEVFEQRVKSIPDHIAVELGNESLAYHQLNERANQLAYTLRAMGVGRNSIVAIMTERSFEMLIGILAILKSGGAYLPIDPSYPKERIDFMIKDSDTKILLTQNALMDRAIQCDTVLDLNRETSYDVRTDNLDHINTKNDLAYIIYTSGSTGKPKGVMIEHASVMNTLSYLERMYPMTENDAFLLKTTFCFDVSVTELFGFFFGKGKVVLMASGEEKDPRTIVKYIKEKAITHINFVPSMLTVFLEMLTDEDVKAVNHLHYLFSAGEAIKRETVAKLLNLLEHVKIENLYGPTEASIYATRYPVTALLEAVNVPIGVPVDHMSCYILDQNQHLRPIGVPGELYIAGIGLARGYLNRSELTNEKFVDNPFVTNNRMYRTGDLVKWLPDGTIEYMGRIDHQLKIRGFRIELDEISFHIKQYGSVEDVVVIACTTKHGDSQLCAYIATKQDISIATLKEYLLTKMPSYMVPTYYILLDQLPLLNNGKVDRSKLPDAFEHAVTLEKHCEPVTKLQQKLYSIWSNILGISKIGINDNFFDIGGNSLLVIEMQSQINKIYPDKVQVTDIFQYPTISLLANYIEQSEKEPEKEMEYKDKVLEMLQQFEQGEIDINDIVDHL